ncbi:MAG TPA: hypothetical protein VMW87_04675 [Spirochaetia bacterium]|nr:hypothetical protein [Spirochaetia bacterium]
MLRLLPVLLAFGLAALPVTGQETLLRRDAPLEMASGNSSTAATWFTVQPAAGKRLVIKVTSVDFTPSISVSIGSADPLVREGKSGSAAASIIVDQAEPVRIGITPAGEIPTSAATDGQPPRFSIRVSQFDPEPALAAGEQREGELSYDDTVDADGRYYDQYTLPVRAGQPIAVVMTADNLDTFLRISLPDGRSFENDDSAGGSAALRFSSDSDGVARIDATSYAADETGPYSIDVTVTKNPVQITTGQSISETLSDDDDMIAGQPSDSYLLHGEAGSRVTIRLESTDFDPVLRIQDKSGVQTESDDKSDDNRNSELSSTFNQAGDLAIYVYGTDSDSRGAYTLSVVEGPAPTTLLPGARTEGTLDGTDEMVDGSYVDHYLLAGRSGETFTISLESESFDAYLVLIDPQGQRTENDDATEETTDSAVTYTFDQDGNVEILASSYDSSSTGAYVLTATE